MSLFPYTLIEPRDSLTPLIVDCPHSGRIYPVDFAYECPLSLLRQAEDAYVDEVIAGASDVGTTILRAEFPRTMIDLNRAENDIDPAVIAGSWTKTLAPSAMTLMGFGLVRRICRNGIALYHAPLTAEEITRRIDTYYRPYHAALENQVRLRQEKFSMCYLIDAHSMPDRIEARGPRADFILGNRDGTSCGEDFIYQAKQILENMGYSVILNEPYKGREIVRRYGLQGKGAHALQVEINRKLYMDESSFEKHQGFATLRSNMMQFFAHLTTYIDTLTAERLAAE